MLPQTSIFQEASASSTINDQYNSLITNIDSDLSDELGMGDDENIDLEQNGVAFDGDQESIFDAPETDGHTDISVTSRVAINDMPGMLSRPVGQTKSVSPITVVTTTMTTTTNNTVNPEVTITTSTTSNISTVHNATIHQVQDPLYVQITVEIIYRSRPN